MHIPQRGAGGSHGEKDVWTAVIVLTTTNIVQVCSQEINGGGTDL